MGLRPETHTYPQAQSSPGPRADSADLKVVRATPGAAALMAQARAGLPVWVVITARSAGRSIVRWLARRYALALVRTQGDHAPAKLWALIDFAIRQGHRRFATWHLMVLDEVETVATTGRSVPWDPRRGLEDV